MLAYPVSFVVTCHLVDAWTQFESATGDMLACERGSPETR